MTNPVRSISHAFSILRLLAEAEALTLSDISRSVGLSPSSCLNVLRSLVFEGAIDRDPRGKQYRLASAWQPFSALRDNRGTRLAERAQPLLANFAKAHESAVGLWRIVSRERMQLIAHAESEEGMRLTLAHHQRQPLGGGAAGRALAAAQAIDGDEMARRFAAVRWKDDLSFDTYVGQVGEAAARGYALDRGHAHRGVSSVAVALADVPPGFCLTASCVGGNQSEEELAALGETLAGLGEELLRLSQ